MNDNIAETTISTLLANYGQQISKLPPALLILAAVLVFGLIASVIAYRIFKNRAGKKRQADEDRQASKPDKNWHALAPQGVLSELKTTAEHGLNSEEIERRRAHYGPNHLPETHSRGPLLRFIVQFHNLLIYVLLGTAVITAVLGHWVDTVVILGVVLINSVIGFVQEGKAEDALAAIRNMLSSQAMVLRNGKRFAIPAEELVPGDIVLLQSGDKAPADLRLLSTKNLQIQEAALTGESVPVSKHVEAVAENAVIGDRLSMAFSGTLVTAGTGAGVVVATGASTQIGHISTLVSRVETLTTPLLRQMTVFARWITAAVLTLSGLIFVFGIICAPLPTGRNVHDCGRTCGRCYSRRSAGHFDGHSGHRRAKPGFSQRDHQTATGSRDAGCGQRNLLRQNRYPDAQRNDRARAGHRGRTLRGQRHRL
jgi:magnesium-transporting ATPase (P-type)